MIIDYIKLREQIIQGFVNLGASKEIAAFTVDPLLTAEACGVSSHGLRMLPDHARKIIHGDYNLGGSNVKEIETSSFARFNCENQIGMVSAIKCMQYAIEKASSSGVFTVFANHCNTYSAAFYYTWLAAKQDFIGITICNSPAQIAPTGGCDRLLGSNPLSYAIPSLKNNPIIFDMATSIVAKSKINQARDKGESIPEGWVIDDLGRPVTDSLEAVKGVLLPMAGAKGYGLSLMIDLLAGVLSQAAFLNDVGHFYNPTGEGMNVGQVFIAINPDIVYGNGFKTIIDEYIDRVKNSKKIEGSHIYLPGERKIKNYENALSQGIEVDNSLLNEFYLLAGISIR